MTWTNQKESNNNKIISDLIKNCISQYYKVTVNEDIGVQEVLEIRSPLELECFLSKLENIHEYWNNDISQGGESNESQS